MWSKTLFNSWRRSSWRRCTIIIVKWYSQPQHIVFAVMQLTIVLLPFLRYNLKMRARSALDVRCLCAVKRTHIIIYDQTMRNKHVVNWFVLRVCRKHRRCRLRRRLLSRLRISRLWRWDHMICDKGMWMLCFGISKQVARYNKMARRTFCDR